MSIYVIYHHTERARIERWLEPLMNAGWQFELAPLGYEVQSEEWETQVKETISRSELAIVFLTERSRNDRAVLWRIKAVEAQEKMLIPILLDKGSVPFFLEAYQYIDGTQPPGRNLQRVLSAYAKRTPICFISYSRVNKEFAIQLSEGLRRAGIQVWRDEENIAAGSTWDQAVQQAIDEASHVLFIVSNAALQSRIVMDEVSYALDKHKTVIPCMLENAELPLRVRRTHWIDFMNNHYDDAFTKLINQLKAWSG